MRILGTTQHVAGWMGGILERAEPDRASRDSLDGRLRSAENFVHGGTGRLAVRGGTRSVLTLAEQQINELVALHRWSPTGSLLVAHSTVNDKHWAYALDAEAQFALPIGTPTESGSRVDLGWNTAAPIWAQGVELFETMFLVDTAPSARQAMKALKLTGGALVATTVQADLDDNTIVADMKPGGVAVYGSVLFAFGYEDESVNVAPHVLRHSLLGQDPTDAVGWDYLSYATVGAQGEPIRSAVPGQDILLVAKYSELFRVFGDPEASPGWQFQIQPVNASLRIGAVNPHAMCYEAGRWWGTGLDGPWVFDGKEATSLVGSRRERWGQVGDLTAAFVEPHPRRGAVLFGFSEPAALLEGQRASRFWVFDTAADRWAPDLTFPSRFWMTRSVAQTGISLDTVPDALAWLGDDYAWEDTALSYRFTPGDVTAQTEVWIKQRGGSYTLAETLAAGTGGGRISGLPRGTTFTVKVRHRKGDALTEFSGEVTMYTRIDAPRLLGRAASAQTRWSLQLETAGYVVTWVTTDGTGANGVQESEIQTAGAVEFDYTATDNSAGSAYGTTPFLTAQIELSDGINNSPPITYRSPSWTPAALPVPTWSSIAVSQQFAASSYTETAINLLVGVALGTSSGASAPYVQVEYRAFGAVSFIAGSSAAVTTSTYAVQMQIPSLAGSSRYDVRAVLYSSPGVVLRTSTTIVMFTRIMPPTASIATSGAGTPEVRLTVRPPAALPGFDTDIENASGSFDALYENVSTLATTYLSTVGSCDRPDTYYVRTRSQSWPEGYRYSTPVVLSILNSCVISP